MVLAAGQSKRMRSDVPKVLHTVLGQALLGYPVHAARSAGATRTVLVVRPEHEAQVRDAFASEDDVLTSVQAEARGTAHAVLAAKERLAGVEGTLLVQLNPAITDGAIRRLRDTVGATLEANQLRAVVLNLASVEMMDSYLTRCIRDLAISARLMGVPTIVCGVQPAVADTLVEMGMDLGDVRTTLNLDGALRLVRRSARAPA